MSTISDRVRLYGLVLAVALAPWAGAQAADDAATYAKVDSLFADFALDHHIPGMVYGIVKDGRLVHVRGIGVQDLESKRPVTPDTLFRIASMSKAFTALTVLALRDQGKVRLDALAETYVPEMRGWKMATRDSPRIRVRDLLNHTGGFVTDDPWGDRQTPMPEAEFSKLLSAGVPFAGPSQTRMEYSNLGYALLGRIVTNVSGKPYSETIGTTLLKPLGMASSGYFVEQAPAERRALGYRWEDNAWRLEPTMAHGAFGAMGGLQTSAVDYAKWLGFLTAAWPPRDDADTGPVQRATVRELAQGSNFGRVRQRIGQSGAEACRQNYNYGMGMIASMDCDLGLTLSHGGGYPGYGSHVLVLADYGVAIFALANKTYAGPAAPVWDSAVALHRAGLLKGRTTAVSADLAQAYRAATAIYKQGNIGAGGDVLAMNLLMDRDAAGWKRDLAELKGKVGDCDTTTPITASSTMEGQFTWRCATGRVAGSILLAPTVPQRIQTLRLTARSR